VVGVIGLGYVGLPLARAFSDKGFPVLGFDVDADKIARLRRGESYIGHIPTQTIRAMQAQGFRATDQFDLLRDVDAVIICVPTPLTEAREPDLTYVVNSARAVREGLRPGQLVVLESTTYPGTTRHVVRPVLEEGFLTAGEDFFLAYSPEREDPGNAIYSAPTIPKVVGGLDASSLELAAALYGRVVTRVVPVSSLEVAEACKILENTYRAVNIALVNELKVLYDRMGIDVWEVIEAAKTKPFGFQAFYPGPGLGGHCLDGAEVVCVRDADGIHVVRFAELFERFASRSRRCPDGVEVAEVANLEALSLDTETGETQFAPATHLFRRVAPTALLRLHLRGNRHLTVTDGHPMLVHNGVAIEERRADEVLAGDRLVISTAWPEDAPADSTIDLIEVAVRYGVEKVRVLPRRGHWREHHAVVHSALKGTPTAAKDVYRHNTLPLDVFLRLEEQGSSPFGRDEVWLTTGKGRSWNRVPAVLTIDEDFALLIGYYLSEGCITEDGALRTRLCFGSHEGDLIVEASAILRRLGFQHSLHRLRSCATVQIKVSSRLLAILLRDVLECGVRSEDARIPARLMGAPAAVRRALLAGLLRGDGDVDFQSRQRLYRKGARQYRHRFHAATVSYFTASPALFQQATLLMQGLGYVPTFHRTRPYIRLAGRQVEALEPLLCGPKRANLEMYREGRVRTARPHSYVSHGAYATVEVVGVEPAEGTAVYSMEVSGTHTFITSFGIAVHNCIPIDPFYLAWVARKFGLTTRFIELAGEVNTAMPAFVVGKIADALNDQGKPVKGSKITLLGMAYKKDVDDPRESPGFELMELLQNRGALVQYNDPFIPRLPPMRRYPHRAMQSQTLTPAYLSSRDCVVVVTDHSSYDWPWVVEHAPLVVDTRNATRQVTRHRERIVQA
jgi:UDP-N-acetyl-D-mannosaminuronate dehydrogenase/intein/homing endonuclease